MKELLIIYQSTKQQHIYKTKKPAFWPGFFRELRLLYRYNRAVKSIQIELEEKFKDEIKKINK